MLPSTRFCRGQQEEEPLLLCLIWAGKQDPEPLWRAAAMSLPLRRATVGTASAVHACSCCRDEHTADGQAQDTQTSWVLALASTSQKAPRTAQFAISLPIPADTKPP